MNKLILTIAALSAAVLPQIALAKSKVPVFVEAKHVKDAPTVTLDSAKAYVLLRTPHAMPMHFVKIPSAEDQLAYDKLRDEAFAEAKEDYAKAIVKYERDLALAKKTSGMKLPKKPVEPTEPNFQFTQFSQMANFTTGPINRFYSKGGGTYLHAVTPGTYRIFGQVDPLIGAGVCYCMGSVTFTAEAGKIVDLGTMTTDLANSGPAEKGDSSSPRLAAMTLALDPVDSNTPVDPRLASLPRIAADLRAAGKVPNYMGIAISRLPAIKGVLGYQRDRVIDRKAAAEAAPSATEDSGQATIEAPAAQN